MQSKIFSSKAVINIIETGYLYLLFDTFISFDLSMITNYDTVMLLGKVYIKTKIVTH